MFYALPNGLFFEAFSFSMICYPLHGRCMAFHMTDDETWNTRCAAS